MKIDIHTYLQKTLIRAILLYSSLFLLVYCYISSNLIYLIPSIIYFIFCISVIIYSDFINSKRD